jgi:hypothetical protein
LHKRLIAHQPHFRRKAPKMRIRFAAALLLLTGLFPVAANAGFLTTTFAGGNQFHGNMFDVTTFGSDLTITGLDVHLDSTGANVPIAVYYRTGTYVGNATSSIGWTLAGTTNVVSNGVGTPTFVDIADFNLSANSLYGMYVTVVATVNVPPYMQYTNGNNTYSNSDLRIDAGIGHGGQFGSLGVFSPRTWNGTLYYDTFSPSNAVPAPSAALLFGLGAPALLVFLRRRAKPAA